MPTRRDGFDTRRPNQLPSVVSTEHAGLLTRAVVVRVHPEGPVNHRRRLVAQLADAARSDRADRGPNPREPTIQSALGPFRGDAGPLGWPLRCQRRVRRVRIPCVPPEWARHCGGKGRRPWEPHKLRHAGSIPASATTEPVRSMGGQRSYKPLTGVRFPHRLPVRWWAKANGAPRGCEPRSSRFDSGRSPQALGSLGNRQPTCFGRRSVEVRVLPTRPIARSSNGRTAASDVADRGSSPRLAASLIR